MKTIRDTIARRRRNPSSCAEFASLRAAERSDSAALIDWRASARCANLVVRDRLRATAISWSAILDASPSMQAGKSLVAADDAAAVWRECAGVADIWLGTRYCAQPLRQSLEASLRSLPARCALLCVSDFYDLPATPPELLRFFAKRFHCTALVVCDKLANELPGNLLRVIDAESGRALPARIGDSQRLRYAQAAAAREEAAVAHLRALGWQAARLRPGRSGEALLQAFRL